MASNQIIYLADDGGITVAGLVNDAATNHPLMKKLKEYKIELYDFNTAYLSQKDLCEGR